MTNYWKNLVVSPEIKRWLFFFKKVSSRGLDCSMDNDLQIFWSKALKQLLKIEKIFLIKKSRKHYPQVVLPYTQRSILTKLRKLHWKNAKRFSVKLRQKHRELGLYQRRFPPIKDSNTNKAVLTTFFSQQMSKLSFSGWNQTKNRVN